jgi:hypothetical protein
MSGKNLGELAIDIIEQFDCVLILREMNTLEVEKNTDDISGFFFVVSKYLE